MAQLLEMPKLSDTMKEGVVRKWQKKEGDKIAPGDVVAEVETDKATMDFESFDEGTILKLLVKDGATVPVGGPIAILATVAKTNRVVLLEEGWAFGGITATIAAMIQEEAFDHLDAPVLRVTQADVPMPYAKAMEKAAKPSVEMVVEKVNQVLYR